MTEKFHFSRRIAEINSELDIERRKKKRLYLDIVVWIAFAILGIYMGLGTI